MPNDHGRTHIPILDGHNDSLHHLYPYGYLVERLGIDRGGFGADFDGATMPHELGGVAGVTVGKMFARVNAVRLRWVHKTARDLAEQLPWFERQPDHAVDAAQATTLIEFYGIK